MSQFKHFYHNFWWGMCLVLVTIASVNAAVPTFTQLAGNWQIDQNNQFQISSTGEISNLTLTIDTDNTDPIQVSLVGATINSGADTPDTTDDNTLDVQGYPVGGILMGNSTDQTPQDCGMNATTTPNGRCHIRIRATFDSAQTVTFRHQPDTDLFGNYSWFSTTGNREDGDEITGSITTATHDINGGPVLSFQGLTNNTLAFGNQTVNTTSAAKTVTVRNTGTANATDITVAFTGNYARPSGTSGGTCGTTLNVGASCTIGITFTPTAAGARNGNVTVRSNAPAVTATLTGVGITGTLTASPASLAFGNQIVNTTSTAQLVTIRNNSTTAPVTGIDLTINGGVHYSRPSGTAGGTCPPTTANNFTLAANGSCTIGIAFKPTATGNRTGTLVIASDANDINVPFTGNGTEQPVAPLSASVTSVSFANQTVVVGNTSTVQTVTLTAGAVAITGINISVTGDGDFARSGGNCGATLAANANCTIGVTFRPTAAGTRNGNLIVDSDNANTINVTLTGTGTAVTPPPPPAGVTSVPVFGLPGLWILTMLLTSVVGMVGFRKQS